ncbi:MAG: DUF1858 domain-containing protein [candidate division KSB1 bacterium]|nr:DUF1858 domain-containing protein [candidate division KSB1 bacterium]
MRIIEITPKTKISELLEAYPELESLLVSLAPAFEKLRNPFLRRTIARVTSLAQAAQVGNVPIADLVNRLREQTGQPPLRLESLSDQAAEPPLWFKTGTIVKTIDARPMLERGEHPIGLVLQEVEKLQTSEILELITGFVPAPLIEKVEAKGFQSWTLQRGGEFKNYFCRKS